MSSTTELNYLDPLYAFITLRDRAALEIIKAVYRPSFISTLQQYRQVQRRQAVCLFELTLAYWWDTPSKPILGDQKEVIGDILKRVVRIIAPEELAEPEALRLHTEGKTLNDLSGLFEVVLFARMTAAGKCAELHEDANFSIPAFHQGAKEEDEILREAFWMPLMVYCDGTIHDSKQAVKIANSIFDELDSRRHWFGSLAAIKKYVYSSAQELCEWCLSTEKGNW